MATSRGQRMSIVSRQARATARFNKLRALSEDGATKAEAARACGMTLAGVDSLLYKRLGTTNWPINTEALP